MKYSLNKYLRNIHYMPGTVVITSSASVNKTAKGLHLHMVHILVDSFLDSELSGS